MSESGSNSKTGNGAGFMKNLHKLNRLVMLDTKLEVRFRLALTALEKLIVCIGKDRLNCVQCSDRSGFSRTCITLSLLLFAATAAAGHPLQPMDTSSPRATIESFYTLTNQTSELYFDFRDSPGPATQAALWQASEKAGRLFDLSKVPPAVQRKVADESFFLLWEVIARLDMPDLESIPDAKAYTVSDGEADKNIYWFIPGTEISIVRIGQGPSAGKYLFSQDTVERVRDFYQRSRDLPYLRPMPISNAYRIHQSVTGWMIPLSWVEELPEWANFELLGQLLWKWLALLVLVGLALAMVIAVFLWQRRCSRATFTLSYLCSLSTPLALLILANVLWLFALHQLNVTGAAAELPGYLQKMTHAIAAVWIILLTMHWITESIIASPGIITKSLNASLIRLGIRFIGIIVVFVFLFRILHQLGVPVYGLVAGAGVGGLAVALAARSTLENFMGTLNLFADRPVRVDDFCRYGEDIAPGLPRIGTVEEIGLRSTRIRGIDRTITSIPNAAFSDMHIINLSMRDKMLFRTKIPLRYETTSDQMRLVLLRLREMLLAHPRVAEDPARVRATGFGDFSLNLEIFAYVMTSDWNDFLAVQEDLVLRTMDIVSKAGTAFAIPSQTVYHSRDAGLDIEQQQAAGKQIRELAAAHELPFPDFTEDYRRKIKDTLDYPPEGSPDADRG